ncbi:ATP-dependent DNA helicase RecG [Bacillus ectoiniformans]|uniref:ATP-binding protein n=1 Tax=Bacillus ectoiniformans TaxID=1494429 RepID=UPI0019585AE2|nr:ATP-binding protein [Bacillus ectoiniformans]MBM7649466.1 ATP-dependent DNA helicase RecG [Bacillus ectoiniformans]
MLKEGPLLELKREITEGLKKEVIAFLNTDEAIRQMIIDSDGTKFEDMRSFNQDLTFNELSHVFKETNIPFEEAQQRTLGLINKENYYTNLGLLLSDQCEHSIKCARYKGNNKINFQDRKEFTGSLIKQVNHAYEYLMMHNAAFSSFEGLRRIEEREYPLFAIREALINAVVHRDYSFSGSILIHIFDDRLEIVSTGGLVQGLTLQDIELGVSQTRNPKLANCFYRIKWIESYGTGLQRIKESYETSDIHPFWNVGPNSFVVTLPKKIFQNSKMNEVQSFLQWASDQSDFTSKQVEKHLVKSKSAVRSFLEELIQKNEIERIGKGPATKYRRK